MNTTSRRIEAAELKAPSFLLTAIEAVVLVIMVGAVSLNTHAIDVRDAATLPMVGETLSALHATIPYERDLAAESASTF